MNLRDVVDHPELPKDIDISNNKYLRNTSEAKKGPLLKRYMLCLINGKKLASGAVAYGKLFLLHYEIRQKLLDEFDGIKPAKASMIDDIRIMAEDRFSREKHAFEQSIPDLKKNFDLSGLSTDEVIDTVKKEEDLTFADTKEKHSQVPHLYSTILKEMVGKSSTSPDKVMLYDYSISLSTRRNLLKIIQKAYLALLVRESMGEIYESLKQGPYESRYEVEKKVDAAEHYLNSDLFIEGLTYRQHAYLVTLWYCQRTESGKRLDFGMSKGKLDYLARTIKEKMG